jgi:hypothetical protein
VDHDDAATHAVLVLMLLADQRIVRRCGDRAPDVDEALTVVDQQSEALNATATASEVTLKQAWIRLARSADDLYYLHRLDQMRHAGCAHTRLPW